MDSSSISRRRVVTAAAGGALALPVLAACGGGTETTQPSPEATPSPPAEGPLTTTADVPVGGGVILADNGVVVTQPTAGEFKAFGSICTHQGCPVTAISKGRIELHLPRQRVLDRDRRTRGRPGDVAPAGGGDLRRRRRDQPRLSGSDARQGRRPSGRPVVGGVLGGS